MAGILTGKGINAQRRIFSDTFSAQEELTDLVTTSSPPIMSRAVVIDVIFKHDAIDDKRKAELSELITNPELLNRAPRNSIIAQIISNAAARRGDAYAIFFPMLPHISQPVKPGEQVWVMFENPDRSTTHGFWLSRIVEPSDVDDPNFTHADRKFDDRSELTTIEKSLQKNGVSIELGKPGFPNGANTPESFTLENPAGYEDINKKAIADKVFKKEPIPRFTKRPGDLVLEGSNNTLIVLGDDRVGPSVEGKGISSSKPSTDIDGFSGTIDIVVGRGREIPSPESKPELTAAPNIINSRGQVETDKVSNQNTREGDPDFVKDSSRIYVSMNTRGDTNFNLTGEKMPKIVGGNDPVTVDQGSFIVAKSDNVRIIARQDDNAAGGAINGSIRIIKEGVPDDESGKGRGAIIIEPDGTVVVDGPHIIIGSNALEKDFGAGEHVYIGRDAIEPLVLGDTLRSILEEYAGNIQKAADGLASFTATPVSMDGGAAVLSALIAALSKFKSDVKTATDDLVSDIPEIRSKIAKTR